MSQFFCFSFFCSVAAYVCSRPRSQVMKTVAAFQNGLVGNQVADSEVVVADNFAYTDPVDRSVTRNQGPLPIMLFMSH
jgi:hypothetical protein